MRVLLRKLFHRCRAPLADKVGAVLSYYYGLSFRAVARLTGYCAESIRLWWLRLAEAFASVRGEHGIVVADETAVHVGKHHRTVLAYRKKGRASYVTYRYETRRVPASNLLWVSIDAKTMRVIHLHLSKYSTNKDCREFLSETRKRTRESLFLLHDRGPWYRSQPKSLGIRHQIVRGGLRSRIECWNRQLKHRLDRFWRGFPPNGSSSTMLTWLQAYAVVWNLTRH
jgi:transposase-like protein